MASYIRPTQLQDALGALESGALTIVAGGTDFYPARVGKPLDDDVLDISALAELHGIETREDMVRIGALVTWTNLIRADLPSWFDGLKRAAREVGGAQVQNAGTIAGNLCNASPAADGVPCLLTMDASVELASAGGKRSVRLDEFITGNRSTVRRPDEIVTAITMPRPAYPARAGFLKLGARKYLVISIAMAAGVLETTPDGDVAAARIAVGACSEVAQRLTELELILQGKPVNASLGDAVTPEHLAALSPIDDVRGSGAYRLDAALTLVRRLLTQLGSAS